MRTPIAGLLAASFLLAPHPSEAAEIPAALAAPGQTVIAQFHAVGAQIYECKPDPAGKLAWQFREPIATLLADGRTMGRHYAGPTWEFADGSTLTGKVAASAPGATASDIAWLRLEVASRRGSGPLSAATTIQRLNTTGGVPSAPCETQGALASLPYAADYLFLRPN